MGAPDFKTVIPEIVMMICSLACMIIGLVHRNKFSFLKYVYLYPLASFLVTLVSNLVSFAPENYHKSLALISCGTNIFLLIEFITFYSIFLTLFKSIIRILLTLIGCAYLLYIGYSWGAKRNLSYYPDFLLILQAVVILVPVFYSLIDIVRVDSTHKRQEDPKFWITFGALIYFGCTLPLFLFLQPMVEAYSTISSKLYFINNICYSILFLSISKAYLCPLPEQINTRQNTTGV